MSKRVFGVDIGGTTVKLGMFTDEGEVLDKWEIPTRTNDCGSNILPDIAQSIKDKMKENNLEESDVIGVGMCVPGPVDDNGIVHRAVNLGWDEFDVVKKMRKNINLPIFTGNDANVAALGEFWRGGGKGYKNIVVVTLGTGVGGGVIVNGKILNGSNGAGGEIGHIHMIDDEEEACGCGNKGCLEQYASANGIARLARRRLVKNNDASSLRDTPLEKIDSKMVFDAVKAGDKVAIEIAEEFGEILGKGLAGIACVINPEIFVIGGGVSKAGEVLFDYIKKNYDKYVFHGSSDVKFALATLGNDAGIFGSAKLVLDGVINS